MQDDFIAKGQPKSAKPDAGKAPTIPMPVYGIVKDNHDDTRQGGIRVYIPDGTGKDPNVKENWSKLIFPLGFYGRTVGDAPKTGYGTYKTNPASYGEWHSPPDIGTKVVCIFINGDPNFGYYLGGVYDPDALHMVPAIGGTKSVLMNEAEAAGYGGAVVLPVVNLNDNSEEASAPSKYIDAAKPVHSYAASILNQQGLIRDPIRGVISSSSQREAASRVGWGVSTPGRPIYQGGFDDDSIASQLQSGADPSSFKVVARRGGHSIVMDDGDLIGRSQLVRIRTALGHQITMSDDGQTLFIIHSNGQSYVELGKEGTVDIYSTNSFNVRTQGDLNLHADRNINIHAEKNLNIRAENIHVQAEGTYKLRVLKDYAESISGKLTSLIAGAYAVKAGGQASMVAGAEAFVVGTKVNLNSGDPATTPEAVDPIKAVAHTDTLFDQQKGFIAAPGKLLSIASRAPAHTPWANAGQGTDAKTELGASANLPPSPKPAVSEVNQAAAESTPPSAATSVSSSAVQAGTNAVSSALNKNATNALLGSGAQALANNPLTAKAQQAKAGIAKLPGGGG